MKERKAFERILSLVLALVMLVGMVPATALPVFAAADVSTTTANVNTVTAYAQKLFADNVDYAGATSKPDRDGDGDKDDPIFTWDTEGKADAWRYYNGLVIDAFLMAGTSSDGKTAADFAKDYYDANINLNNTSSWTTRTFSANPLGLEVDSIAPIRGLFDLLTTGSDGDYETFLNNVYGALANPDDGTGKSYAQLSTSQFTYYPEAGGNYIHKPGWINENPGWHIGLDGLYMAQPFLAEYAAALKEGKLTNGSADCYTIFGDIYDRFVWVLDTMDMSVADSSGKTVKLYHHGWNVDTNTGNGVVWARGVGWLATALVDVLELMPAEAKYDAYREGLIARLQVLLDGMLAFQETDGMWNNVVYPAYAGTDDYPNKPETSGTALMAYALMKAYNNGWVGSAYGEAGLNAFNAVVTSYCSAESMTNIYRSASVGTTAEAYCVSEKYNCDGEGKGVGPLIMAAAVANDAAARYAADSRYTVELNDTAIVMPVSGTGNVQALVATVKDADGNAVNAGVTWTSTDSGVATVDQNGVITAVSAGVAVIKATITYTGTNGIALLAADTENYTDTATVAVEVVDATADLSSEGTITELGEYVFTKYTSALESEGVYLLVGTNNNSVTKAAYVNGSKQFQGGDVTIGDATATLTVDDVSPYLITISEDTSSEGYYFVYGTHNGSKYYVGSADSSYLTTTQTSIQVIWDSAAGKYGFYMGVATKDGVEYQYYLRLDNSDSAKFTRNNRDTERLSLYKAEQISEAHPVTLSVDRSILTLTAGVDSLKTETLTPAVTVDGGTAVSGTYTLTWSSADESVATVNDGTVTAVAAGETTITATLTHATVNGTLTELDEAITVEIPVTVAGYSLTLTPEAGSVNTLTVESTLDLSATIEATNGTTEGLYCEWYYCSSDAVDGDWEKIGEGASITEAAAAATFTSAFTPKETGSYQVTCVVYSDATNWIQVASEYITVEVTEGAIYTLTMVPAANSDTTIYAGNALNLSASMVASDNDYSNMKYQWYAVPVVSDSENWDGASSSNDTEYIGETVTWQFKPTEAGTYHVWFKVYDVTDANEWKELSSGMVTVVVAEKPSGLTVAASDGQSEVVEVSKQLQLTVTDSSSGETLQDITWSSDNESVLTVDSSGKVLGRGVGKATVTATWTDGTDTVTGTMDVTVLPVVEIYDLKVYEGDSAALYCNINSGLTTGVTYEYTYGQENNDGNLYFTFDEAKKTVTGVMVTDSTLPKIIIKVHKATLSDGTVFDYTSLPISTTGSGAKITVLPATEYTLSEIEALWLPLGGTAALDTDYSLTVTVVDGDEDTANDQTVTINNGSDSTNTTGATINWESDNEDVITVDANGNLSVVGYSEEPITITATLTHVDGNAVYKQVSESFEVNVIPPCITAFYNLGSAEDNSTGNKFYPGQTKQVSVVTNIPDGFVYTLSWVSRDETYATVDQNGVVTALKPTKGITNSDGNDFLKLELRITSVNNVAVTKEYYRSFADKTDIMVNNNLISRYEYVTPRVYISTDYISSVRLTSSSVLVVDAGTSVADVEKALQADAAAQATWLSGKSTVISGDQLLLNTTELGTGTVAVGAYDVPVSYTYTNASGEQTADLGSVQLIVLDAGSNGYSLPVMKYTLNTEPIKSGETYVIVAELDGKLHVLGMGTSAYEDITDVTVKGDVLTVVHDDLSYELTFTATGDTLTGGYSYTYYTIGAESISLYVYNGKNYATGTAVPIAVAYAEDGSYSDVILAIQKNDGIWNVFWYSSDKESWERHGNQNTISDLEALYDSSKNGDLKLTLYKGTVDLTYGSVTFDVNDKTYELMLSGTNTAAPAETVTADNVGLTAQNYDITWSSLDEKVATVDKDGNITAVGPGVTQILVTLNQITVTDSEGNAETRDIYDLDGSAGITKIITVTVLDEGYRIENDSVTVNKNGTPSFENVQVYADSDGSLIDSSRVSFDLAAAVGNVGNATTVGLDTSMPGTYIVPVYVDGLKTDLTVTVVVSDSVYDVPEFIEDIGKLPQYPEAGSVAIDKTASGYVDNSQTTFINSGVAQIELDVAGMSANGGVDVILVVDVSNSMGWDMDNTGGADDAAKVPNSLSDDDKLDNVMDAATEFANILLADQDLGNTISFVTFAGYDHQHTAATTPGDLNQVDSVQTVFSAVTDAGLAATSFQGTQFVQYKKGENSDGTLTGKVSYYLEIRDENGELVTGIMAPVDSEGNVYYEEYGVQLPTGEGYEVKEDGFVYYDGERVSEYSQTGGNAYIVNDEGSLCVGDNVVCANFVGWKTSAGKNRGNTNYDYAFGQAMDAVEEVKQAWLSNPANVDGTTYENSGRKIHVIFMTDGAPTHYNDVYRDGKATDLVWHYKDTDDLYDLHSVSNDDPDVEAAAWLTEINKHNVLATELYSQVSGMYNIAFDIEHGAFGDYSFDADALVDVLTGVVKNANVETMSARDPAALTEFYKDLASSLKYAGKDAVVVDELSAFYTLYTGQSTTGTASVPSIAIKAFTLYTEDHVGFTGYNADGTTFIITEDHVGERMRDVNGKYVQETIEKVTFPTETSAYSEWYENGVIQGTLTDIVTTDASGNITQIKGHYFTYTRTAGETKDSWMAEDGTVSEVAKSYVETFEWNIGDIPEKELALIYTAYLIGAYDNEERFEGMYPTNHQAHLYFTTADGDYAKLAFPEPEMSWKDAMFSIRFHLVNEAGEPINYAGLPTGSNAILSEVGERLFQWMEWDTSEENVVLYAHRALLALKNAYPGEYDHFQLCDQTAYYSRGAVASADHEIVGNGIVFLGMTPDGYQTGISIGIVINKVLPDQVVIDYGKPIYADVVANDVNSNKFISVELMGIVSYGASGIGTVAALDPEAVEALNGLDINAEVKTGQGYFSIKDGKVLFTPTQFLDEVQRVYAILRVKEAGTTDQGEGVYYANRVDVIPATVMYYETDFGTDIFQAQTSDTELDLSFTANMNYGDWPSSAGISTTVTGPGTYSFSWTPVYTEPDGCEAFYIDILNAGAAFQGYECSDVAVTVNGQAINVNQDALWYGPHGDAWRIAIYDKYTQYNGAFVYAVDAQAFVGMTSLSITFTLTDPNASQSSTTTTEAEAWANVDNNDAVTDEYNEWVQDDGTVGHTGHTYGYDSHYSATELNDNDAQYDNYLSDGSSLYVEGQGVNKTEMGFTFTGTGFDIISRTGKDQGTIRVWVYSMTTGELVRNVAVINKGINELYQIPVVSIEGLEYGEYRVVIGVYAEQIYTQAWLQQYNISNEFYFDAIRIYNPVVATDATANLAYYTDNEYNHEVVEIGQHLIDEGTIDKLDDNAITGVIYLDDQGDMSNDGTTSDIGTYDKIGANNEVYLKNGDGVSFLLTSDVLPDSIDIGAKIIQGGASAVLNVTGYSVESTDGVTLTASVTQTVNVGTQQYFDMTDELKELFRYNETSGKYEAYIVIWNTGADVLSITDIKLASGIASATNSQSVDDEADAQLLVNATAYSLGVRTISEASNYDVAAASFTSESVKSTDQAQITVVTSQTVARLQVTDENGNVVESHSLYVDTATGDRVWTVSLTPINLGEQTFTVTGYNAEGEAGSSASATIMVTL